MARKSARISPRAGIAGLVSLSLAMLAPAPAAAGRCKNAGVDPVSASAATVEQGTRCLLNQVRRHRGRRPLRANERLRLAATRHAQDMADRQYFSHTSNDGSSFLDRIRRVDYLPNSGAWRVGENLAWGTGSLATPNSIVDAWMDSPPHRANILNGGFREIGIGIGRGAPVAGQGQGATYATEFGARL
jgi:uncharacterized protein YkwD